MRSKKQVLLCALGLLLVALLTIVVEVSAKNLASRPGPFFIFPEGTDWYILERYGGPYYHTGCEDGSCTAGPIKGYDYIAPRGTEILAPFSGTTTATCLHDGVGNTVFTLRSENGRYEFGALHLRCKVSGIQQVNAGDVIGWVDSIGKSYEPHCHCWFRDLNSRENIQDHDQFWDGIDDSPSPPEPEPPPGPEDPEWLKKLKELRDKLTAWVNILDKIINWFDEHPNITRIMKYLEDGFGVLFKLIRGQETPIFQPSPIPTPVPEPEKFNFSIQAQKPGDTDYQHNIRVFFAWPTSGENLEKMNQMDLMNFEGSWTINPGVNSVNGFFGSEKYEEGQGMVVPSTGGIGDGSCNAASFISYVASMNDLPVDRDNPTHAPVPGVPQEYVATVCIPTEKYKCQTMDVRVTNTFNKPIVLHWQVIGDTLTLWLESGSDDGENPNPGVPAWLYCLGGILLILIVFLVISWLLPHKTSEALIWIKNRGPYWYRIIKSAFFESLRWWLVELALIWLFWPQIREITSKAFWTWGSGSTLIANWKIMALMTAIVINLFLRVRVYVRVTRDHKGHFVERKRLRGCLSNLGIIVIALVLFVLVAAYLAGKVSGETPDPPTPPVPGECSLTSAVPERTRRWCDLIDQNAEKLAIDSAFIAAVIDVESKGNPEAMSECDAVGLMQVMPSDLTPKTIACGALSCSSGHCFKGRPTIEELKDPATNIQWGSQILASHYRRWGSYAEAAHYYNYYGGQAYVDQVMKTYRQFGGNHK